MDKERILTAEETEKVAGGGVVVNGVAKKVDVTEDAVLAAAEAATAAYGTAASNSGTATVSNGTLSNGKWYTSGTYNAKDAIYKGKVTGEEHMVTH